LDANSTNVGNGGQTVPEGISHAGTVPTEEGAPHQRGDALAFSGALALPEGLTGETLDLDLDLADRIAALSASASGGDGSVTVTVAGSGNVTGLRLDDRVRQLEGARLSAVILRTIRRAQAALTEQVAVAVDETVGTGSGAGKAVLDSFIQRFPLETDETQEPPMTPVMPTPPFPTFRSTPTLPQQTPGNGFESGRDSRAR
jgi:DNA-binding protein YbaB